MNWKKYAVSLLIAGLLLLFGQQAAFAVDTTMATEKGIDAGNSISDAVKIALGNTYEGNISDTNSRDFYAFTLVRPAKVTINASAHVKYISYKIYNEAGEELFLWRPTWNSSTRVSTVNESPHLQAGTYYFAVEQYSTPIVTYGGKYSFKISSEADKQFTDVASNAYYTKAVEWATQNGITSGVTDSAFRPNRDCTRAQIVMMLWRAMDSPKPKSSKNSFQDVKSGDYFYNAVLWAVENGITSGTTSTTFSPNTACTRAQAMTFLWTQQGKPVTLNSIPFKDVSPNAYYYPAVRWAVKNEITSGTSAAAFSPNSKCTRAQIVVFLYQTMA